MQKAKYDFIPDELTEKYQRSDLEYDYCVVKFGEMQAAKRDNISRETMRVWFREFIRLGWDKNIFDIQFNALMESEISGHAIRIDNWINAQAGIQMNKEAYEMFKPLPEQREKSGGGLLGLREYIDELDKKLGGGKEKKFYVDRKTGKKVFYPVLPDNWKSNLMADFRRGDRIKSSLRKGN